MREKNKINIATIGLVVLAVFTTAFAFINYRYQVPVWPLGGTYPLTLVIFVSLVLGIPIGALAGTLIGFAKTHRAERLEASSAREEPVRERPVRDRPGRP